MSTELTGGAGFAFEDAVAALFLARILTEGAPPGLPDTICQRILFQRGENGHPLDDLVVEARRRDGVEVRLDLQITTKIALTARNAKLADIVRRAQETMATESFISSQHRVGAAVGSIATNAARDLEFACEAARDSVDSYDFSARLSTWSASRRKLVETIRRHIGKTSDIYDTWRLLRHFVLLQFSVIGEGSRDVHNAIEILDNFTPESATLWHRLLSIAQSAKSTGGSLDRPRIEERLRGSIALLPARAGRQNFDLSAQFCGTIDDNVLPLVSETFRPSVHGASALEIAFSKRRTRFVGRSEIRAQLGTFLSDGRTLLWWQLSGDGGQGKSRLALETVLNLDEVWHSGFLSKRDLLKTDWKKISFPKPTLIVIDYLSDEEKAGAFVNAMRDLRARISADPRNKVDRKVRFLVLERSPYDFDHEDGLLNRSWLKDSPDIGESALLVLEETVFQRVSGHIGAPTEIELVDIAESWRQSRGFSPLGTEGHEAMWKFLSGHRSDEPQSRAKGARPLFAIVFAETYKPGESGFTLETGLRRVLETERRQLFGIRNAATPNLALLANMIESLKVSSLDELFADLAENHNGVERVARFYGLSEADLVSTQLERAGRANGYTGGVDEAIEARVPDFIAEFQIIETLSKPGQADRLRLLAADAWQANASAFMAFLQRIRQDFGSKDPVIKLLATTPSAVAVSDLPASALVRAAAYGLTGLTNALLERGALVSFEQGENPALPLLVAAQNGHPEIVAALISAGADVNERDEPGGMFPLLLAAQNGHTEIVASLVANGADVNQHFESDGLFPLILAAQNGHSEIVTALVAAGAEVNKYEKPVGTFPLYLAVKNGHAEIVTSLIAAKADANQVNEVDGTFPLLLAVMVGHPGIVKKLIAGGSDVNQIREQDGAFPLLLASQNGHTEIVSTLIGSGADVNQHSGSSGSFPLLLAAKNGHSKIVGSLITAGADANRSYEVDGPFPLLMAVLNDYPQIVAQLIAAGADVNRVQKLDGAFPLLFAVERGYVEITSLLISAGAKIDQLHLPSGASLLILAAQEGHVEILTLLIAAGADVNFRDERRGTFPLLMAAKNGHTEVVNLLIRAGASLNGASKSDSFPLLLAAAGGHVEVVSSLISAGSSVNQSNETDGGFPLLEAVHEGHSDVVASLIAAGSNVNQVNKVDGTFPLLLAAQAGSVEVISALIAAQAGINQINQMDGNFALLLAAQCGHAKIVTALISAGAQVNLVNGRNSTFPLYLACQDGHLACALALIKAGSNTNQILESNGTFPLLMAVKNGHTEVVIALVESGADVNQRHWASGITPLGVAMECGNIGIVEILMNFGAQL